MSNDVRDWFRKSLKSEQGRVLGVFVALLLFGLFPIVLAAGSKGQLSVLLIWSFGCLLMGALVGFLFGIPKILQGNKDSESGKAAKSYRQNVNTNLEQISDWVTHIIVGLGLFELAKIPGKLVALADYLSGGLGAGDRRALALALIVYFTILGFLFSYLMTRLFLTGMFSKADQLAAQLVEEVNEIKEKNSGVDPRLIDQALSKAPTEVIIKGEPSFKADERDSVGVEVSEVEDESQTDAEEDKLDYNKAFNNLPI